MSFNRHIATDGKLAPCVFFVFGVREAVPNLHLQLVRPGNQDEQTGGMLVDRGAAFATRSRVDPRQPCLTSVFSLAEIHTWQPAETYSFCTHFLTHSEKNQGACAQHLSAANENPGALEAERTGFECFHTAAKPEETHGPRFSGESPTAHLRNSRQPPSVAAFGGWGMEVAWPMLTIFLGLGQLAKMWQLALT